MSRRVIAVGRTMSGKTEALWRRYLRYEPRLLIIDNGEWRMKHTAGTAKLNGEVVSVYGAAGVADAMLDFAERRIHRWTIIADADRDELEAIQDVLIPPGRWEDSPVPDLGGLAIFMDEVDLSMPTKDNRLSGFNRRGRHVQLSVYMASQRPASVNKECTSQVDFMMILSLDEPRDVDYLRSRLGNEKASGALTWAQSAPYRCGLYHPPSGQLWRLPPEPA